MLIETLSFVHINFGIKNVSEMIAVFQRCALMH